MQTSELQYGQVNNVLTTFNTSNLPIGIFSSFRREKLQVFSSNSFINKALNVNLHDKKIIVKIDWRKYAMKQASEDFTLTVKYNNKAVDALTVKFRINFIKKEASTKVSISHTQVMWNKDMYVDLIVEPNHSQSEMWKFLSGTKSVKILANSKFKPIDGAYEVQFNVLEKKKITLKYEYSAPIASPIMVNQSEKIVAVVDAETWSFDIILIPNNNPNYKINLLRLKPSYTIGSNELDLWKLQIINENPYAVLSINDVITDSDKLEIRPLGELEWIISLKSVEAFKKNLSSNIFANIEVQASCTSSKNIGLVFSPISHDDARYINIKEGDCLQLNIQDDVKTPIVVYRNNPPRQIPFNLKNVHPNVTVENIRFTTDDEYVQIVGSDNHIIRVLRPNNIAPIFAIISTSNSIGKYRAIIEFLGEYAKRYLYELHYEVKEKMPCSLNVGIVPNTIAETYAGENYNNHKICEVQLKACVDDNFGIEGSLPILVNDIKVSPLFSIRTNANQIEPGKTITCDLLLNGMIESNDQVTDFNKLIEFKYEHE